MYKFPLSFNTTKLAGSLFAVAFLFLPVTAFAEKPVIASNAPISGFEKAKETIRAATDSPAITITQTPASTAVTNAPTPAPGSTGSVSPIVPAQTAPIKESLLTYQELTDATSPAIIETPEPVEIVVAEEPTKPDASEAEIKTLPVKPVNKPVVIAQAQTQTEPEPETTQETSATETIVQAANAMFALPPEVSGAVNSFLYPTKPLTDTTTKRLYALAGLFALTGITLVSGITSAFKRRNRAFSSRWISIFGNNQY